MSAPKGNIRKSRFSAVLALVLLTLILLFVRIETGTDSPARYSAGVASSLRPQAPPPSASEEKQDVEEDDAEIKQDGLEPIGSSDPAEDDDVENKKEGLKPVGSPTETGAKQINEDVLQEAFEFQKEYLQEHDDPTLHDHIGGVYLGNLENLETIPQESLKYPESVHKTKMAFDYAKVPPMVYDPYTPKNDEERQARNWDARQDCEMPFNITGEASKVITFPGQPMDYPQPTFGSYDALDLEGGLCFERRTRLGPYGYTDYSTTWENSLVGYDFSKVNWAEIQDRCFQKNVKRFKNVSLTTLIPVVERLDDAKKPGRTAVIVRASDGKSYTEDDKRSLRSLISELSLGSGGEYQVFLLVQMTDNDAPIWQSPSAYEGDLDISVPREFWDITVLWNQASLQAIYPEIPQDTKDFNPLNWLAVQQFANLNPQYDHYWNWEVDTRYTGHYYELFQKVSAFASAQPKRGLWERNERFYIPSYHGDYDTTFRTTVEEITGWSTLWGVPFFNTIKALGPKPPVDTAVEDDYEWGLGEAADLITLSPIFNPVNTDLVGSENVIGYAEGSTPRRAFAMSHARLSRTLLYVMQQENIDGKWLGSELAPATISLLHGFKAVYAPHPVFFDRGWKEASLVKYFNPGPLGESGTSLHSAFGFGRQIRFEDSTWFSNAEAARRLWKNWMGSEDGGIGGAEYEKTYGRPCLPPMLLYPVADIAEKKPINALEVFQLSAEQYNSGKDPA